MVEVVLEASLNGLATWGYIGFSLESHCLHFYEVMPGCHSPPPPAPSTLMQLPCTSVPTGLSLRSSLCSHLFMCVLMKALLKTCFRQRTMTDALGVMY